MGCVELHLDRLRPDSDPIDGWEPILRHPTLPVPKSTLVERLLRRQRSGSNAPEAPELCLRLSMEPFDGEAEEEGISCDVKEIKKLAWPPGGDVDAP